MIERPILLSDSDTQTLTVADERSDGKGGGMRFWGGLAIAIAAVTFFVNPDIRGVEDMWGLAIVLTTAVVGGLMISMGGKPKLARVPLAEVKVEDAVIEVLPAASSQFSDLRRTIWFEEVASVLVGLTRFPLEEREGAPDVEAFTVCLQLFDASIVPVVEATTDKSAGFLVARQLAETIGVPIEQAGLGA